MEMNIIMRAGERETIGPRIRSGTYQPVRRVFMDDLTATTGSIVQAKWILTALDEVVTWALIRLKTKNIQMHGYK